MAYLTSENQPIIDTEARERPLFRIALPVWRISSRRDATGDEEKGVTRDEIASMFGTDLVSRRLSKLHLTESERAQLDVNAKLRNALYSH